MSDDMLNPAKILVADDEESFRSLLRITLEQANHSVTLACDGLEALHAFENESFDLVILDIIMPRMDGLDLCAEIRRRSDVPIILLTALNRNQDVAAGLALGADDYITKPYSRPEFNMRVHALLRRASWSRCIPDFPILAMRDMELDRESMEVNVDGRSIPLTSTECRLLSELMLHADRPLSKDELYMRVWGAATEATTNVVEVAIRRLRTKIEPDPSKPIYLETVRGVGYRFSKQTARDDSPRRPLAASEGAMYLGSQDVRKRPKKKESLEG